MNPLKAVIYKN